MTYAELVQKIRDYTEVGSEVLTATIVNGFIRDSEFKIFREADADYAREYATTTFTANNKFVALPNPTAMRRQVPDPAPKAAAQSRCVELRLKYSPNTALTAVRRGSGWPR